MATLKLIACDVMVGLPRKPYPLFRPDAVDLDRELERLEISAAIVRHRQCIENFPHWGNDVLAREAAGRPNWIPAECLTPDGAPDDHSLEATLARAFNRDMRIAWISPREHMFSRGRGAAASSTAPAWTRGCHCWWITGASHWMRSRRS